MSLLGKSINEVIQTIYQTIKSKREIIASIQTEYLSSNQLASMISISRFKLIDLLDEFEITISQSLQGIQTLQTEICNLQEAQKAEAFKTHLMPLDNQGCLSRIIPQNLNDDLLFDSIQTNMQINNSMVNESVSNITNMSQVYHKPKATKPLNANANSRLKYEYGTETVNALHVNNKQCNNKYNQINDLLISYGEIEGEPIEQDKSRLPIRQSIRAGLIKQSFTAKDKDKDISISISSHNKPSENKETLTKKEEIVNKLNQIEKEKNNQVMLSKISQRETCRIYFGDKYAKGSYEEFVRQCNRKEIDLNEIQREYSIMEYIAQIENKETSSYNTIPCHNNTVNANGRWNSNSTKIRKVNSNLITSNSSKSMTIDNNNHSSITVCNSNNTKIDEPPKSKRKHSINKTESSLTMKQTQQEQTIQSNPYIEPINFSNNYLRGANNISKSQRSNTKPKEITKSLYYKSNHTQNSIE